uniref:AAA+ ATPase domain-containing protein n=1 Tax=Bionectria ochroleuca TaxID=29856 RepID=A0A8H7N2U1_BIOOC
MSFNAQNIHSISQSARQRTTAAPGSVFDASQFKIQIGKDVPSEIIQSLQTEFGLNMGSAIDKFYNMDEQGDAPAQPEPPANIPNGNEGVAPAEPVKSGNDDPLNRKEFVVKDQYWDKVRRRYVVCKPAQPRESSLKHKPCVIYALRVYTEDMITFKTQLRIPGQKLRNALQNIFRGAQGFGLTESENTEIRPEFLFWAKPELQILSKHYSSVEDKVALFEMNAALKYIEEEYETMISILSSLLPHSITFEYLWALLPPDCLVVGIDSLDLTRIWRVRSHATVPIDGRIFFVMQAEVLEWDGDDMGYTQESLKIPIFEGFRALEELPYVPLKYHPRREEVVEHIQQRNTRTLRFWKVGFQLQEHQGTGLATPHEKLELYPFSGRVIIDPKMMRTTNPFHPLTFSLNLEKIRQHGRIWISDLMKSEDEQDILSDLLKDSRDFLTESLKEAKRPRRLHRRGFPPSDPSPSASLLSPETEPVTIQLEQLSKEQLLLVSGLVYGYSMQDGMWGGFAVERVWDVTWNTNAMDSLVLDKSLKDTVTKLVIASNFADSGFDDFIKGKGKGFIALLSGPPGSGKTLTAEAIAETARMPLYMVSSGALGHEAEDIHKKLAQILKLASHWKAVLLLDEADVFLAARTLTDIKRNAIVSIFLRELEYYQGILILTTNHANFIDQAFQSRIHLSLQYDAPDLAARKSIWQNFAKATSNSRVTMDLSEADLDTLAAIPLNGRQVKNAMVTPSVPQCPVQHERSLQRILLPPRSFQACFH